MKFIDPITYETMDIAFFNWVKDSVDPWVDSYDGFQKVPVLWVSQERTYQIKNNLFIREDNETYKFPLIIVSKQSISPAEPGERPVQAIPLEMKDFKQNSYMIHQKIMQEKTSNFANMHQYGKGGQINFKSKEKNPVVIESWFIKPPLYFNIEYKITIKTNFEQQINAIAQKFDEETKGRKTFNVFYDNILSFEVFAPAGHSFSSNSENLQDDERVFERSMTFKLLGYTTEMDQNQKTPVVIKRESPAKIRFGRTNFQS